MNVPTPDISAQLFKHYIETRELRWTSAPVLTRKLLELFIKRVRIDMKFARLLPIIEGQDNAIYTVQKR